MRVLMDARMLGGRFSGVSRYVVELIRCLSSRSGVEVVAFCQSQRPLELNFAESLEVHCSTFTTTDRSPEHRLTWEMQRLGDEIHARQPDLWHATWNSGAPLGNPVPTVLTVHDLIEWRHTVSGQAAWKARLTRRAAIQSSVRAANAIITVSQWTQNELHDAVPASIGKTRTVHNGVRIAQPNPEFHAPTPSPYFLYVGGFEARKNVRTLLQAARIYWDLYGCEYALVLTGSERDLPKLDKAELEAARAVGEVRFAGVLSERDLAALYCKAVAVVLLSTAEGFGLPALEAMAYGQPVIASNCAALPEVLGGCGILVSPHDPQEAANAMHRMTVDAALRERMVRDGMIRSDLFSWEKTADATLEMYEFAVQRRLNRRIFAGCLGAR